MEMSRINVCYYITGHGWGHATRSMELICCLLRANKYKVNIVSPIDPDFFFRNIEESGCNLVDDCGEQLVCCHQRTLDSGAIQRDVLTVDAFATLSCYFTNIHNNRDSLLSSEVQWMKQECISLVLVDSTPLGCKAGQLAGCKVVLVTNFTWDYIYHAMLESLQNDPASCTATANVDIYKEMIAQCTLDSYACDRFLQYPGAVPSTLATTANYRVAPLDNHGYRFSSEQIIPCPLITRPVRHVVTKESFDIPAGHHVLLLGFGGGHSAHMEWTVSDDFLPPNWSCFVLGISTVSPLREAIQRSKQYQLVPPNTYIPDLVAMVDVVLGKIGYGFTSECLALKTPLVYIPRSSWPEESYLAEILNEYSAGIPMPFSDFRQGRWEKWLLKALKRKEESWILKEDISPSRAADVILQNIANLLAEDRCR